MALRDSHSPEPGIEANAVHVLATGARNMISNNSSSSSTSSSSSSSSLGGGGVNNRSSPNHLPNAGNNNGNNSSLPAFFYAASSSDQNSSQAFFLQQQNLMMGGGNPSLFYQQQEEQPQQQQQHHHQPGFPGSSDPSSSSSQAFPSLMNNFVPSSFGKPPKEGTHNSSSTPTSDSLGDGEHRDQDDEYWSTPKGKLRTPARFPPHLIAMSIKDLNQYVRENDMSPQDIKDLKVQRRRAKNRSYASLARQRKDTKISSLTGEKQRDESEIHFLKNQLTILASGLTHYQIEVPSHIMEQISKV